MGKEFKDWVDEFVENGANPKDVTNWPENGGGQGGGSVIVDTLPAQGVEGTTYLLRKKNESKVFKGHAYAFLYSKVELPFQNLVFIDTDFNAFGKSIEKKLNPSLNSNVNFSEISNVAALNASSVPSGNWNDFIERHNVVIVTTEEDVLNITEDVDCIVQDLGEIGVENLGYIEHKIDGEWLAGMYTWLNTLGYRIINQNNKIVEGNREVEYNSELEPGQTPYSFTEWQEQISDTVVGTFTDTYEYDTDTLMNLEAGNCYFITLTPDVPKVTYSYTEYVFDQGVYAVLGNGGSQQYATAYMITNGYLSSFTFVCEDPNIETFRDLVQYLYDRGFKNYSLSEEYMTNENSYLPCSGNYNDDGFILAGGLSGGIYENGYYLYVATSNGMKEIQEDEYLDFSILYLGQEQGE